MLLGLSTLTWIHTLLSLIGMASGLVVVQGLLAARRLDGWAAVFLLSAVATSATGFVLPAAGFGPSHWVGVISLVVLAVATAAKYAFHFAGIWQRLYAVSVVLGLYFLVFVGVAQLFAKVPALRALAPTQSEPPFAATQIAVLVVFIALAIASAVKFRARAA